MVLIKRFFLTGLTRFSGFFLPISGSTNPNNPANPVKKKNLPYTRRLKAGFAESVLLPVGDFAKLVEQFFE